MLAHDHDGLGEHHEPHAPERLHDLARLARIALPDRDDDHVVEHALGRHVHVHDLGEHQPHDRQEDALGGLAEPVVFLRRPADDRRRIDRPRAPGERGEVKHGVVARQRVVARVIAERAFAPALGGVHVSLQDDLGLRRHLQLDRPAGHELHPVAAQPAGEDDLVDSGRQGGGGGVDHRRVAAERDRHRHARGGPMLVLGAALVRLPVHAERAIVEHLQPIHPDVARAGDGIAREHAGQRDVAAAVAGPAFQDRQCRQRRIRRLHDLLAGRGAHTAGRGLRNLEQRAQFLQLVEKGAGHLQIEQLRDARAEVVEPLDAQRRRHAVRAAEGVDEHRHLEALHVLEEERDVGLAPGLRHAVDDLGDLEVARDGRSHAAQVAATLEVRDELAQVAEGHRPTRDERSRPASRRRRGRRGSG